MTAPANNDRKSESALDYLLESINILTPRQEQLHQDAVAELSALRTKAAAYDAITKHAPGTGCVGPDEMEIPT